MDIFLPNVKKIHGKSVAEDIIGLRPNETFDSAINRYMLEQRRKKINKIAQKINKKYHRKIIKKY